ncbi:MAG TPA: glycosyltransferase family 4 protein, partial [Thermoleophilia bacterium]|nr:glycosyltransferase family 4 protein [Thermoleophilia bacterium]
GLPLRLLFVGSFLHAPNEEAARYLVRKLAPALRLSGLPFVLTLAGRGAPAWLSQHAGPDLRVLSDVDDLAPLYREADVVLAPLAHGGGTKNKTLEAMAWGLPVLGTPQAFTGLGALDGEAFVCTTLETDAMVADLRRLAADPGLRAHLGAAGRKYVAAAHTEDLAEARAMALFDAVAFGGGVPEAEALWRSRPGDSGSAA